MPDIKLHTKLGGNEAGTTITVTPGVASYLTEQGYAEAAEGKKRATSTASSSKDSTEAK